VGAARLDCPVTAPAPSPPLSRLLDLTADLVQGVRSGRSATDLMARARPTRAPAVQALGFDVLRRLGAATELRALLAPKTRRHRSTTCCAPRWRCCGRWPSPPYPDHTLVDQAVTAARQRTPAAAGLHQRGAAALRA
jgi:16S rRNA (cytosine967-C5)-methyltransferase